MKISVAMCTYNGATFLREQLDSIAVQTRLPDELVVCDDDSRDATSETVAAFAAEAPFPVRLLVNEQNLGSTKNFERAIGLCEGDIIALSDQDDVWLPEKLRQIEDYFLREPTVGLVFTEAEVVDDNLQPLGYRLWESIGFDDKHQRLMRTGRVLDVLLPGWTVTGATMAFRASFKDLVLEIPTNLALIHDGWIALLIGSVAGVSFIEEPLIKYRQHTHQQIGVSPERAEKDRARSRPSGISTTARSKSYRDLIEIGDQVRQRLAERRDLFSCDEALAKLDARLTHMRLRASLPASKLSRARSVVRELATRRYHLYSNGVRSAARDLFTRL